MRVSFAVSVKKRSISRLFAKCGKYFDVIDLSTAPVYGPATVHCWLSGLRDCLKESGPVRPGPDPFLDRWLRIRTSDLDFIQDRIEYSEDEPDHA